MESEAAAVEKPRGLEQKWKVLITLMMGVFMIILDSTIVNIAFPTLRQAFGASLTDSQWVISIYVMALGITTPVAGFLRRPVRNQTDVFARVSPLHPGIFVMRDRPEFATPDRGPDNTRDRRRHRPAPGSGATLPGFSSQGTRDGFWNFRAFPGDCTRARSYLRRLAGRA